MKRDTICTKLEKIFKDEFELEIDENTSLESITDSNRDLLEIYVEDVFNIFLNPNVADSWIHVTDIINTIENIQIEQKLDMKRY